MEQSYDSSLKFGTTRPGDGVGAEGLPNDALTDVGRNKEGDA